MKKSIILIICSLTACSLFAYDDNDYAYASQRINKIVPISPNAASLGIFGSIPVGHYTGVPDISIPIYNIVIGNINLPISLSYHASGIRVSQESSTVGLGWALNAGGCITREIKHWDDFGTFGYYWDTLFPIADGNNELNKNLSEYNNSYLNLIEYLTNIKDSEPDIFYFNFGEHTGSFFFDRNNENGDPKVVISNQKEYLDIKSNGHGQWEVYDDLGNKYIFAQPEVTAMYSSTFETIPSTLERRSILQRGKEPYVETAWYLSEIVLANSEVIRFIYDYETVYSPIQIGEDTSFLLDIVQSSCPHLLRSGYNYYSTNYTENTHCLLKSIQFNGGEVTFNYSDRYDIESTDKNKNAQKIESIIIKDNDNNILKKIKLEHSYMGQSGNYTSCRLFLDEVNIVDTQNVETMQNYSFEYNKNVLPEKNSKYIDHWGYIGYSTYANSGDSKFNYAPPFWAIFPTINGERKKYFGGICRDANESSSQYGILTSIQYPTGGKTNFEYELNEFSNGIKSTYVARSIAFVGYEYIPSGNGVHITESRDFSFNRQTDIKIESYAKFSTTTQQSDYIRCTVQKKKTDGTYGDHYYYDFVGAGPNYHDGVFNGERIITLSEGTYRVMLEHYEIDDCIAATANVIEIGRDSIFKGGGLRIKRIVDLSSDSDIASVKTYKYEKNGISSGILMVPPEYHEYFNTAERTDISFPGQYYHDALYINGNSNPYIPITSHMVGYSYVEERTIENGNNSGYIAYTFDNRADRLFYFSSRMVRGYPSESYKNNGAPLMIAYYDSDNKLLRQERFKYSRVSDNTRKVKGLICDRPPMAVDGFNVKFYDLIPERWVLSEKVEIDYFNNDPISTVVEYGYNNKNFRENYVKRNINGNKYETHIKYPSDYSNIEPYKSMIINNVLSPIVEKSQYKDNVFLHKQVTDYKKWNSAIFLPELIKRQNNGESSPQIYIAFNEYDNYGNPKYIIQNNSDSIVYLWGYSGKYLIAEIKNATYDEVKNILGISFINNLTNAQNPTNTDFQTLNNLRNSLKDAHVSTYTYQPLVGMTSMTNPSGVTIYYDYDSFGRLKESYYYEGGEINKKRVLQAYEYNYQNQ